MPLFAICLGKMLFILNPTIYTDDYIKSESDKYCLYMVYIGIGMMISGFLNKFSFGVVGENVTLRVRKLLYSRIIEKPLGWFDKKENAPGILTTTMASDVQVLNGVSVEGIATVFDALCALGVGIAIGFIFSWKETLVCLACTPFIMMAGAMSVKF